MNDLLYYCNLLYIDDIVKTESDKETYKNWIKTISLSCDKSTNKSKIVNDYFKNKESIIEKVESNKEYNKPLEVNNESYKNSIKYAILQFEHMINQYNQTYNNVIFLQSEDLDILYQYLKNLIDKKIINMNYYDLFIDLLNRTCARGLYEEKNIFLENFILEIPNIDQNNEELKNDVYDFYNSINNNITSHVIDISERKK